MNGYKFAEDNPFFKDSVESFVQKCHYQRGFDLDELHDIIPYHEEGLIYFDFLHCLTEQDRRLVKGKCTEKFKSSDFNYQLRLYFEKILDKELEHQVNKFIAEAPEREREAQNA